MEENKIRVAITQGDTNGVGYEVILKTFGEEEMADLCTPIIYGNPRLASYHRKSCGITTNFHTIRDASEAQPARLNFLICDDAEAPVSLGKPTPEGGRQALLALERALADYKLGKFDALVTAPIHKGSIQSDQFRFPGHTEYLQAAVGGDAKALMILVSPQMRVALATTHLPLSRVPAAITEQLVTEKLTLLRHSLRRDFAIPTPRIAVLSLNPHAGDGGLLGREEQEVIIPAISKACEESAIKAFGPYPADGFFGTGMYDHFDGILAMYHDQGLAPFKALAGEEGVNFTAGLPLVRTSPGHGTAYDIAGKGVASESSFRHAIYAAIDIFRNRQRHDEAWSNPLEKLYHERREGERRGCRAPEKDEARPS